MSNSNVEITVGLPYEFFTSVKSLLLVGHVGDKLTLYESAKLLYKVVSTFCFPSSIVGGIHLSSILIFSYSSGFVMVSKWGLNLCFSDDSCSCAFFDVLSEPFIYFAKYLLNSFDNFFKWNFVFLLLSCRLLSSGYKSFVIYTWYSVFFNW
jgi:hypothetical protein